MATVKLDALYKSVNGRLGNYVFYNRYDKLFARTHIIPQNPDTGEQRIVRKTFGNAVRSWQRLKDEEKNKYNKKARRLNISGYNLYISGYMKENITMKELKRGKSIPCIAPARLSLMELLRDSSVSTAYTEGNCIHSPYIPAVQSPGLR